MNVQSQNTTDKHDNKFVANSNHAKIIAKSQNLTRETVVKKPALYYKNFVTIFATKQTVANTQFFKIIIKKLEKLNKNKIDYLFSIYYYILSINAYTSTRIRCRVCRTSTTSTSTQWQSMWRRWGVTLHPLKLNKYLFIWKNNKLSLILLVKIPM